MKSISVDLPGDASEEMILDHVMELNANPEVHGMSIICKYLIRKLLSVVDLRSMLWHLCKACQFFVDI